MLAGSETIHPLPWVGFGLFVQSLARKLARKIGEIVEDLLAAPERSKFLFVGRHLFQPANNSRQHRQSLINVVISIVAAE